ncbi:hypothetical protein, partial [Staphylococcus aureus]|uniref:hypothetical protein n=1 Tax=Staphylococcus aureus TaxID=1280 RepID=UPI0039BE93EB
MITNSPEEGSSEQIPFTALTGGKLTHTYRPFGRVLILSYEKPTQIGDIILPHNAKPTLEFVEVKVLFVGH